jgi:glycosyltransferase involved in cell wall biosynthesis
MKNLNVLQVAAALSGQGGVERGTVEMAKYLVSRGVGSFVTSRYGSLAEQLTEEGSTHIDLPLERRDPITIVRNAFRIARVIRQRDISIVHASSRAPAWSAFWACKMTGVPFVTTFHGRYGHRFAIKRLYNSVMTRGRQTIAGSKFIQQHIVDRYGIPEERITLAYRGFNPERIAPEMVQQSQIDELRDSWGVDSSTTVFVLIGRITRLKGHALMFRALANVERRDWIAVIVGGEGKKHEYFRELQNLVNDLGLEQHIQFAGVQSNVTPYYAAADVVVVPSIEPESFGLVAVEGQAMGKPVIATAHGGSVETIQPGKTGLLVDYRDPTEMTAAFEKVLSMSRLDRETMGEEGQRWVLEHFTVDKMCQGEFSAYEKVLGTNQREVGPTAEERKAA